MPVTKYTDLPKDERDLWEDMLTHQGLSMDRGTSPAVLSYGWNNAEWNDREPFDYSLYYKLPDHRGGKREGAGRKRVEITAKSNPTMSVGIYE